MSGSGLYAELAPSARFAAWVECCWTYDIGGTGAGVRVLPDGCADLLFAREFQEFAECTPGRYLQFLRAGGE